MSIKGRVLVLSAMVLGVMLLVVCALLYTWRMDETTTIEDLSVPLGNALVVSEQTKLVIGSIRSMEVAVGEFLKSQDPKLINQVTMAILRKERYGYGSKGFDKLIWGRFAGTLESEAGINPLSELYVAKMKGVEAQALALKSIDDSVSGDEIDLIHMVAVIDLYFSDTGVSAYEEAYYDALFSWMGDLVTFTIDMNIAVAKGGASGAGQADALAKAKVICQDVIAQKLGTQAVSYFSRSDFLADLDGVVIAKAMRVEGTLLSDALEVYYRDGACLQREALFVEAIGGIERVRGISRAIMLGEPESLYAKDKAYDGFLGGLLSLKGMMLTRLGAKGDLLLSNRELLVKAFWGQVGNK